ncbi:MAG: hypothetical protein II937_16805 [Bacteroidales bacterium]|nr:hypothetical protein [Bacteroidales bacterium]
MKNKIALIQPYFGKFPDYFALHLLTIAKNPEITWIFFTDDKTPYQWSKNCEVHYMEFPEMQNFISEKFDFKIALEKPYKVCDFRPAFGYIFEDYLKCYDFWGHCDVDVLWGNMQKFLTDEVLENHDFLFRTGHFRLYRNIEKMNQAFRNPKLQFGYKEIFTHNESYCFDEMNSRQRELLKAGFRYYDNDNLEADTDPFLPGIQLREVSLIRRKYRTFRTVQNYENQIFVWENGSLFRYYIDEDIVKQDEFSDIHFLKRKMDIVGIFSADTERIIISPFRFYLEIKSDITKDLVLKLSNENSKTSSPPITGGKFKRFFCLSRQKRIIALRKNWYNLLIKIGLK